MTDPDMNDFPVSPAATEAAASPHFSTLAISLLRGVIYRDGDERLWGSLLNLQARVRDYMSVLGLELVLDEAEGYAFLRSRAEPGEDDVAPRPKDTKGTKKEPVGTFCASRV